MRKLIVPATALVLAPALPGQAPQQPAEQGPRPVTVFWEGSLEAATARATRLGRPVMVAVLKPSESRSRRFLQDVYSAPEVRKLLREVVCVAACEEAAAPIERGPRKGKSAVFRTVTVAEHQAVFAQVRERYLGDRISAPQHVFLDPAGHLIERRSGSLRAEELAEFVAGMLDRVDPSWRPAGEPAVPAATSRGRKAGGDDSGAVPWAGLFDRDVKRRKQALQKLLAEDDSEVVQSLFKQIADPETKQMLLEGAHKAVKLLGCLKPLIVLAIDDADPGVRREAAVAAQRYRRPDLLDTLAARFKNEKEATVARELLQGIATCAAGERKALEVIAQAAKSKDERMRASAYVAMGVAGGHSNDTASKIADALIKRGLKDRSSSTRRAAVWSLGEIRSKRSIPYIEKLMKRERKRRQELYLMALKRIKGESVDSGSWEKARRDLLRENRR